MSQIKRIMFGGAVVAALCAATATWVGVRNHPLSPHLEPGSEASKTGSPTPIDAPRLTTDSRRRMEGQPQPGPVLSVSPTTPPPPSGNRARSIESPSVLPPQPRPEVATEVVQASERPRYEPPAEVVQRVQRTPRTLQDPLARVALAQVGADMRAEAYWIDAIFDPTLPDEERDDLMEDLNEVGFSNGELPGPGDLPLIINRIAIVEELLPYADGFMHEHLSEAHKDLMNMLYGKMPE